MSRRTLLALARRRTGGPLVVSASPRAVFEAADPGLLGPFGRRPGRGASRPGHEEARVAAHLLLRWCAGCVTGRPPTAFEVVQRCAECGSDEHGKPSLAGFPDLHVSLAHRPGAVVAAVGRTPVAVDVEVSVARLGAPGPAPDVLSTAELDQVRWATDPSAAFLQLWVRKECLVKLGVATLDSVRNVDLAGAVTRGLPGGATATRFGPLHMVHWVDRVTGATVAAAGLQPPVRGALLPTG